MPLIVSCAIAGPPAPIIASMAPEARIILSEDADSVICDLAHVGCPIARSASIRNSWKDRFDYFVDCPLAVGFVRQRPGDRDRRRTPWRDSLPTQFARIDQ